MLQPLRLSIKLTAWWPVAATKRLANLDLGFNTFKAHGVSTDVYQVTLTHIRARTTLQLDITFHLFLLFPIHQGPQFSQVDWEATSEGSNLLLAKADEVFDYNGQLIMAGSWHGYFHRIEPESR